jgi:hypothetical protein
MKQIIRGLSISAMLVATQLSIAQAPNSPDQTKILALIKEVQIQQAQIVDNEAKIETKVADVAEKVRVARIYAARGR